MLEDVDFTKPTYHVLGELPVRNHHGETTVLMDIYCKDLSDARAVLLARIGVYRDLRILDPEGKQTK